MIFVNGISAVPSADGAFATTQTVFGGVTFTLKGTAPNTKGVPWAGTYDLENTGSFLTTCPYHLTGSFTATPIADLTGTFTGSSAISRYDPQSSYTPPAGTIIGLDVAFQQRGYPPGATAASYSDQYVGGTIQVTGIPCFKKGTSSTRGGAVLGNDYRVVFTMDDGSDLELEGTIQNAATTHLFLDDLFVIGGACQGTYQFFQPAMDLNR